MTTRTRLFAVALAAATLTTTTFTAGGQASANGLPRLPVGHGPVVSRPVHVAPGPIQSPPHPIAHPLDMALKAPPRQVSGVAIWAAPKPPPAQCGTAPGQTRCLPGPGGPVPTSGGGGGFGTFNPGPPQDQCFEEFRCQQSVD